MQYAAAHNQIDENDRNVRRLTIATAQAEKGNRFYDANLIKYQKWIEAHPLRNTQFELAGHEYFSETAINTYFVDVVSTWNMQVTGAQKHMAALNQELRRRGNNSLFGHDPPPGTKQHSIENGRCSAAIKAALASIAANNFLKVKNNQQCAHTNLPTNIISQEDISRMCTSRIALGNGAWQKTAATLSTCSITLMRFENARKMTIDKLIVLNDLPPHGIETPHDMRSWESTRGNIYAADGKVLGCIIPKIDQIKKNARMENIRPEVTGGYRHKRYERCYHSILGFSILELMHRENQNVSFLDKEYVPAGKVHWTSLKVFHQEYTTAHKAYVTTRAEANVKKWAKETHFRYVREVKKYARLKFYFKLTKYGILDEMHYLQNYCTDFAEICLSNLNRLYLYDADVRSEQKGWNSIFDYPRLDGSGGSDPDKT